MVRLVAVWLLSLAAVAGVASTLKAQRSSGFPRVITGADVAFKAEGVDRSGKVTGAWVVRVDGQWREVSDGGGLVPATPKIPVEPR